MSTYTIDIATGLLWNKDDTKGKCPIVFAAQNKFGNILNN